MTSPSCRCRFGKLVVASTLKSKFYHNMENTMSTQLLDRDYKDIDHDLLGVSSLKTKDIAKPDVYIAPAQGNPFLEKLASISGILRRYDVRYRE